MTLRVLHATDAFLTRSETFVYTYVTAHRRFEATVLCHGRVNAAEFPFLRVYVAARPTTRRTPNYWIAAAIERTTGRSPWRRLVERILAAVRPDVIHAHFGPIGCELIDIAQAARIPLVTSLYGVDAAVLPRLPQWREAYARLFAGGALFLAEGPEMLKKVVAAGAPRARTALQPIAIRPERYPRWAPEGDTILFVGRFVEKKGLLDAIAAFADARDRMATARLVIVGAGPQEAAARALVAGRQLGDVVDFAGMRSHDEVIDRLRRARVLIHPSVTAADGDSEGGAPTILLEAQAIGTPIVTTRHADIPNVVPPGPGVWLCDEHDVASLADALAEAFQRQQASSSEYVHDHHSIDRLIGQLEDRYQTLVDWDAADPSRAGAERDYARA